MSQQFLEYGRARGVYFGIISKLERVLIKFIMENTMTIQVEYSASFSDGNWDTLNDFFNYADGFFEVDGFGNVGTFAGEENSDPIVDLGWFWGSFGTFSGTQYMLESDFNGESLGFIVETADGEYIDYTFFQGPATHTLYGEIASITFGRGLVEGADGEFSFTEELVSFDGLDTIGLNSGIDANGNVIDRDTGLNDTHNIVYGMMQSDFSALSDALVDGGIDLNAEILVGVSALENLDAQLLAA